MKLILNYSPMGNPMDGQDIKWLQYVWESSDGKEVYLYEDKIPDALKHTVIYSYLFQRFSFYKDSQKLLKPKGKSKKPITLKTKRQG